MTAVKNKDKNKYTTYRNSFVAYRNTFLHHTDIFLPPSLSPTPTDILWRIDIHVFIWCTLTLPARAIRDCKADTLPSARDLLPVTYRRVTVSQGTITCDVQVHYYEPGTHCQWRRGALLRPRNPFPVTYRRITASQGTITRDVHAHYREPGNHYPWRTGALPRGSDTSLQT